jgi:hypothetical protein
MSRFHKRGIIGTEGDTLKVCSIEIPPCLFDSPYKNRYSLFIKLEKNL